MLSFNPHSPKSIKSPSSPHLQIFSSPIHDLPHLKKLSNSAKKLQNIEIPKKSQQKLLPKLKDFQLNSPTRLSIYSSLSSLESPLLSPLSLTPTASVQLPKRPSQVLTSNSASTKNCICRCAFKIKSDSQLGVNQDFFIMSPKIGGVKSHHFFAVCDGNGKFGASAAKCFKNYVPTSVSNKIGQINGQVTYEHMSLVVRLAMFDTQEMIKRLKSEENGKWNSFSCVLICGSKVVCGNVGDSRVVVGWKERNWQAEDVFKHFKATEGLEGKNHDVDLKNCDRRELEIVEYQLRKRDKFIIIANGALWRWVGVEETVEIVSNCWQRGKSAKCLDVLLAEVAARAKKSSNVALDITIVAIFVDVKY